MDNDERMLEGTAETQRPSAADVGGAEFSYFRMQSSWCATKHMGGSAPETGSIQGKHFEVSSPSPFASQSSENTPGKILPLRELCASSLDIWGMAYTWVGKYNNLLS